MKKIIRVSGKMLLIINFIFGLFLIIAAFSGKVDPKNYPSFYLLMLLFPVFLLINSLFFFFWLFIKRKFALVSAIAILISTQSVVHFFAFNIFSKFDDHKKSASDIRFATWNVNYFQTDKQLNGKMFEQIKNVRADVLCMQEFFAWNNLEKEKIIQKISETNGYQYYYRNKIDSQYVIGNIIFSKYPIINHSAKKYVSLTQPDQLLSVDIKVNNSIVRVYTTHLQSNLFDLKEKARIDSLKKNKDRNYSDFLPVVRKLKIAEQVRSAQADLIRQTIIETAYPVIFCGDCNDVPNSYTYNKIKSNMQDGFLRKGFGIGRTYNAISPTLRIDFIFSDKKYFTVRQVKRYINKLSDHYMYVCDLALKN